MADGTWESILPGDKGKDTENQLCFVSHVNVNRKTSISSLTNMTFFSFQHS